MRYGLLHSMGFAVMLTGAMKKLGGNASIKYHLISATIAIV